MALPLAAKSPLQLQFFRAFGTEVSTCSGDLQIPALAGMDQIVSEGSDSRLAQRILQARQAGMARYSMGLPMSYYINLGAKFFSGPNLCYGAQLKIVQSGKLIDA